MLYVNTLKTPSTPYSIQPWCWPHRDQRGSLQSLNTAGAGWRPVSKYKGLSQDLLQCFCSLRCRAEVSGLGSQIILPPTCSRRASLRLPSSPPSQSIICFCFLKRKGAASAQNPPRNLKKKVSAWRSYTFTDQISGLFSIKFWLQHKRA